MDTAIPLPSAPTAEELVGESFGYCYMGNDVFPLRPLVPTQKETHDDQ